MELTSKQRAQLRGLASTMDTIVQIGKNGMTENLVAQTEVALEARELIKCKALENSEFTAREAAENLAKATRSEVVQVIGTKFVLYRQTHSKPKSERIELVTSRPQRKAKPVVTRDGTARREPVAVERVPKAGKAIAAKPPRSLATKPGKSFTVKPPKNAKSFAFSGPKARLGTAGAMRRGQSAGPKGKKSV